jgi:stalled ribosome rescue protein Dom34
MSARNYAIVWINHNAAEVFRINAIEESKRVVNSHTSLQSLHHRAAADGGERHPVDTDYFERIASTLNHVGGTLLAGPGEARFELGRYLGQERPDLAAHVHELETPDHPGDAELVSLARDYFHLNSTREPTA